AADVSVPTVSPPSPAGSWRAGPMVPDRCTVPASGVSRPARTCGRVVLPRPFSPTTAIRDRAETVTDESLRTRREARVPVTRSARMWALPPASTGRDTARGEGAGSKEGSAARRGAGQHGTADLRDRRGQRGVDQGSRRRPQRPDLTRCEQ